MIRMVSHKYADDDVMMHTTIVFRMVSHNYGYGLMDAEAMVKLAR